MVTVTKARTSIQVRGENDAAVTAILKTVNGYAYDANRKVWSYPLDVDVAEVLWARLKPYEPRTDKPFMEWFREAHTRRERILACRTAVDAKLDYEQAGTLYKYQRVGVEFLATARRAILTDGMGLGKTAEAIATIRELELRGEVGAGLYLVVCPNSVKHTWRAEIHRWYNPDADVRIVKTGKELKGLEPAWYICNWELMWRRMEYLDGAPWDVIIGDESHRMKNKAAKVTKGMLSLKAQAPYKYLLTGTPIKNDVMDLWTQLHFLDPTRFSSYWKFFNAYADTREDFFGHKEIVGVRNEEQLRQQLATVMFGRKLEDIEVQLPAVTHKTITVDLEGDQLKAYQRMKDEFIAWLESEDEEVFAGSWLTQILRLKQLAGSLGIFYEKKQSAKLDALDDLLDELGSEKMVVMSQFRTMVDEATVRFHKQGIPYCELTGKSCRVWTPDTGYRPAPDRQQLIDYFQSSATPRVFIATTQTGGEGITLTAARYLAFLDLPWTPAEREQAWKRVHRTGQARACFIYQILARDTVDFSAILPTLRRKQEVIDAVLKPGTPDTTKR